VYKEKEVINEMCALWDGYICFELNSSDEITENKTYDIQVSDTVVISLDGELKCMLYCV
jgi:hypothetical protein